MRSEGKGREIKKMERKETGTRVRTRGTLGVIYLCRSLRLPIFFFFLKPHAKWIATLRFDFETKRACGVLSAEARTQQQFSHSEEWSIRMMVLNKSGIKCTLPLGEYGVWS